MESSDMKVTICSVAFLAVASLAEAQIGPAGQRPLAISCEQFSLIYHQKYFLDTVRSALKVATLGGALASTNPGIQNLGDDVSVGVLKVVDPKDLTTPKVVKAYLQVVRTAFSQPQLMIACAEDKIPNVTMFLLDYLREKVKDKELQRQIDSTKEYVLKQAPLKQGNGN
jgi:hypothetical protein